MPLMGRATPESQQILRARAIELREAIALLTTQSADTEEGA